MKRNILIFFSKYEHMFYVCDIMNLNTQKNGGNAMQRSIYHIDCNSFYAAVECRRRPELRDVPMAVAGDPKDRCGIILAKNERAKAYGVKTAETIYQAKRKCPDLVLVAPHFDEYMEVSHQVKRVFADYTDQVESFGSDEAWLDVTGSLRYFRSSAVELADSIRHRVMDEIGITVSVGVSFNKVFAKLGSDLKKPDATTLITPQNYQRRVWPLPADSLLFVGRTAAEQLERHYIHTIGDVARTDPAFLEKLLGKGGETLWQYANGLDETRVRRMGEAEPPKSIGNGMTFRRDLLGWDELKAGIVALSDEVAARLRAEGMKCMGVHVNIRNPQMKTISRQCQLSAPTHLQKVIVDAAMQLVRASWREELPVRALTVTAQQLMDENSIQEQMCILGRNASLEKFERAEACMQKLRLKYGRSCMAMGYVENQELRIRQFHREGAELPGFSHEG